MSKDDFYRGFGEWVIKLFGLVFVVAIVTLLPDDSHLARAYVGAILSFAMAAWWLGWKSERKLDRLVTAADALKGFTLRAIRPADVEATVRSLYATPDARFWVTHVNYVGEEPPTDDWASALYTDKSRRVPFFRVVSVSNPAEIKWVRSMVEKSVNPDFDLRVVQESPDKLLYPNMIVVQTKTETVAFLSFRSLSNDGSGRFAFVTSSPAFTDGLLAHLAKYHHDLKRASELYPPLPAILPTTQPQVADP